MDQHVIRLTNRLELVATDPAKMEALVTRMVPPSEWTGLERRLILHGLRICVARRPLCEQYVLNDVCPSSMVRSNGSLLPLGRRRPQRLGRRSLAPADPVAGITATTCNRRRFDLRSGSATVQAVGIAGSSVPAPSARRRTCTAAGPGLSHHRP